MPVCQWKWILEKTHYFNELPHFGQFFKYTLFGSPFLLSRVPIGSPFHSKLGPHWVPMKFFLSPQWGLGVADTAFFQKMNIFIEWIIRLFFEWMNSLNEYFWFSFEWINSLNEYFRRTIEWIIEWIRKVRYSYEKWTKNAFFGRNGPLLPVFHCFLKLWFVFQFEWIILLNEYFWLNLNE